MNEIMNKIIALAEKIANENVGERYEFLFEGELNKPTVWAGFNYLNGSGGPEALFVVYGPRTFIQIPFWGVGYGFVYPYGDGQIKIEGEYSLDELQTAYERLKAWDEGSDNPHPAQQVGPIFTCSSGHYFSWPDGRYGGCFRSRKEAEEALAKGPPEPEPEIRGRYSGKGISQKSDRMDRLLRNGD